MKYSLRFAKRWRAGLWLIAPVAASTSDEIALNRELANAAVANGDFAEALRLVSSGGVRGFR